MPTQFQSPSGSTTVPPEASAVGRTAPLNRPPRHRGLSIRDRGLERLVIIHRITGSSVKEAESVSPALGMQPCGGGQRGNKLGRFGIALLSVYSCIFMAGFSFERSAIAGNFSVVATGVGLFQWLLLPDIQTE